jgi:hypothetical protein
MYDIYVYLYMWAVVTKVELYSFVHKENVFLIWKMSLTY